MSNSKSILASIWVVRIIIFLIFASVFIIPTLGNYYSQIANQNADISLPVTIGFYILLIPANSTMITLHMLLMNIKKGNLFSEQNIAFLAMICAGLFIIGGISLIMAIFSWIFSFVSVAFLFVAVILLVIINVFKQAIIIKQENDFTI